MRSMRRVHRMIAVKEEYCGHGVLALHAEHVVQFMLRVQAMIR